MAEPQQQQFASMPLVVDAKLAAGRGEKFSAGALADESLDDGLPTHWYPEGERAEAASTSTAIDESNKGFQLLQKMGWSKGKGLGKKEAGVVEPVAAGVEAGVRLGLGKQQQDDTYTAAEGISRKKLESEMQIDEDPDRTRRREAQVQREELIKQDVSQILKTFYCQVCAKQYAAAMELEEHLSSYDHHHRKRLAEARAAELERTRDERTRKEQRRQQREQQRLEEQIRKAQAAAVKQQGQPAAPPLPPAPAAPPPPPPPPVPPAAAVQIAAGTGLRIGLGKPVAGRGGAAAAAAGAKRPPQRTAGAGFAKRGGLGGKAGVSAAFAESSSEDEG